MTPDEQLNELVNQRPELRSAVEASRHFWPRVFTRLAAIASQVLFGEGDAELGTERLNNWRNIAITLKIPFPRSTSVIAFHEKAGRSQVGSSVFSLNTFFLQPSGHCRHASIRTLCER